MCFAHPLLTTHQLKVVLARLLPLLSSINKENMDVFPAFEILFTRWTKARDRKVVVASLQTVGYGRGVASSS